MRKKIPLNRLKKKAWAIFSHHMRKRYADEDGTVKCVTCKWVGHYTKCNLGHFQHGHSKLTFMDERNVHIQCVACNLYKSGNLIAYYDFMRTKYGQDTIDALRELSHQIWKPTRQDLEDIIRRYRPQIGEADCVDGHREISEKDKVFSLPAKIEKCK